MEGLIPALILTALLVIYFFRKERSEIQIPNPHDFDRETDQDFQSTIAGVKYEGREKAIRALRPGEQVLLVREPDNPHGTKRKGKSTSIKVISSRGEPLGYIPSRISESLSQDMDSGAVATAVVEKLTRPNKEFNFHNALLRIRVYNGSRSTIRVEEEVIHTENFKATFETYRRVFNSNVEGVTESNEDGTSRQDLLKRCKAGQKVRLATEPDNSHDPNAIAVLTETGQKLGCLSSEETRLVTHIARGGEVKATIKTITGGLSYGCILEIIEGDLDWKAAAPWMEVDRKARELIRLAITEEENAPDKAVELYREANSILKELDSHGNQAAAWRTTRYPINRLTLALERMGKCEEALKEIAAYEMIPDKVGLTKADSESLKKRKARLTQRRN